MRKLVAMALGILGIFLINSWGIAQEKPGNPRLGKDIYEKHCLHCHGAKGDGTGPDAQYLTVRPANFHSLQSRSKTDMELLTIIAHGVVFSPMHGWRDRLTEEEMMDVLSYIRMLAPFNPIT